MSLSNEKKESFKKKNEEKKMRLVRNNYIPWKSIE